MPSTAKDRLFSKLETKINGSPYTFLSNHLGVSMLTVYKWGYAKSSGGTEGNIPTKHIPKIYNLCKQLGIEIEISDLVNV